jgi:hypothetical protein
MMVLGRVRQDYDTLWKCYLLKVECECLNVFFIRFWKGGRVAEGDGLLNRCRGVNPYRGFESLPFRVFPNVIFCHLAATEGWKDEGSERNWWDCFRREEAVGLVICTIAKPLYGVNPYRGFESLPLRPRGTSKT